MWVMGNGGAWRGEILDGDDATFDSICFSLRGFTISTGADPPRNVATSSTGSTVADSPIRAVRDELAMSNRSRKRQDVPHVLFPQTA